MLTDSKSLKLILIVTILFSLFTFMRKSTSLSKGNEAIRIEEDIEEINEQIENAKSDLTRITVNIEDSNSRAEQLDDKMSDEESINQETISQLKKEIKELEENPYLISFFTDEEKVQAAYGDSNRKGRKLPEFGLDQEFIFTETNNENVFTLKNTGDEKNQRDYFLAGPWALTIAHYEDSFMSRTFSLLPNDKTFSNSASGEIDIAILFDLLIDQKRLEREGSNNDGSN